ncbi:MAG TPA: class I SAM-dependent methyltransferase, partial [Ktedonobacteraceae bacterium]|nr:class I SAM-dependent methyltransferase [Ktedonobacteraceae bacterium]
MQRIWKRLELGTRFHGSRILDLGAGTGPGSIAALELDRQASATLIDFPEVLEREKAHEEQHEMADRVVYLPADLASVGLGCDFDFILASHLFRILGPHLTQKLIKQSYQALKPGGRLIIIETYNE